MTTPAANWQQLQEEETTLAWGSDKQKYHHQNHDMRRVLAGQKNHNVTSQTQTPQMVKDHIVTDTTPMTVHSSSNCCFKMAHRARSHRGGKTKYGDQKEHQARQDMQSSTSLGKGRSPGGSAPRNLDSKSNLGLLPMPRKIRAICGAALTD